MGFPLAHYEQIATVCLCACFVGLSVYSCGYVHVWVWVRNAWPCWEEWLLYSCVAGAMGAAAVSLGSCMDGLRRSPSFITRTPTCRIDLAKKQGGNSSSSVFPDHKSLRGVPLGGRGDTIVSASVPSDNRRGRTGTLAHEVAPKGPGKCEKHSCKYTVSRVKLLKNIYALNNRRKKRLLEALWVKMWLNQAMKINSCIIYYLCEYTYS